MQIDYDVNEMNNWAIRLLLDNGHPCDGNGWLPLFGWRGIETSRTVCYGGHYKKEMPDCRGLVNWIIISRKQTTSHIWRRRSYPSNHYEKMDCSSWVVIHCQNHYQHMERRSNRTSIRSSRCINNSIHVDWESIQLNCFSIWMNRIATEDKQPIGHVIHTDNTPPTSHLLDELMWVSSNSLRTDWTTFVTSLDCPQELSMLRLVVATRNESSANARALYLPPFSVKCNWTRISRMNKVFPIRQRAITDICDYLIRFRSSVVASDWCP